MRTFKLYSAALLMFAAIPSFAQDASERNSEIGSKVLMQEGTDKVSWKNGKYTYEKILEVPGVDKKTLYERAKAWVKVNVKTSQDHIYFDDNEQNSILATTAPFVGASLQPRFESGELVPSRFQPSLMHYSCYYEIASFLAMTQWDGVFHTSPLGAGVSSLAITTKKGVITR